tara:strand:+ start:698 stop:997 length:300 start_codon:yes stop_codon:yes gene_type:complete
MDKKHLKLTNKAIASIENIEKLVKEQASSTKDIVDEIRNQTLVTLKQEELIEILKRRLNNHEEQIERYEELLKIDNNKLKRMGVSDGKVVSNDCGVTPI